MVLSRVAELAENSVKQVLLPEHVHASHALHAACPSWSWYFPLGQAMQEVDSGSGWW